MDIIQHIQDIINRLQREHSDAQCSVRHWADMEEGAYIDFVLSGFPLIVVEIDNHSGSPRYCVSSTWHNFAEGGNIFYSPPMVSSLEDVIIKLNRMISQYASACHGIQKSFQWKEQ